MVSGRKDQDVSTEDPLLSSRIPRGRDVRRSPGKRYRPEEGWGEMPEQELFQNNQPKLSESSRETADSA